MTSRLKGLLAGFAASVVTAATLVLITATPASAAFGDENFGCRVSPGSDFTYRPFCTNNRGSSVYNVGFVVENTSAAAGYSYSWSINGQYLYIINNGCGPTSAVCGLAMAGEQSVTVTVTYTLNGQSATKSASAYIASYCGSMPC